MPVLMFSTPLSIETEVRARSLLRTSAVLLRIACKYQETDHNEAMRLGGEALFAFNPGKDQSHGILQGFYHPECPPRLKYKCFPDKIVYLMRIKK